MSDAPVPRPSLDTLVEDVRSLTRITFCVISVLRAPRVTIPFFMTPISHVVTTLRDLTRAGVGEVGGATKEAEGEAALGSEGEAEVEDVLEPSMPHHPALQKMAEQWMMMVKMTKLTQVAASMRIMLTSLLTLIMTRMSLR